MAVWVDRWVGVWLLLGGLHGLVVALTHTIVLASERRWVWGALVGLLLMSLCVLAAWWLWRQAPRGRWLALLLLLLQVPLVYTTELFYRFNILLHIDYVWLDGQRHEQIGWLVSAFVLQWQNPLGAEPQGWGINVLAVLASGAMAMRIAKLNIISR